MEKFIAIKDVVKTVRRFNLQGRTVEFKLKPVPKGEEPIGWIKDAVFQTIQRVIEGIQAKDQLGVSFCSKEFKRGEGWIRFQEASKVSVGDIWNTISNVYQSNSTGLNTETFCLSVTSVHIPTGKGRGRKYNNFDEECGMRRGIVTINNKDNLCLPRAIVVAIAHVSQDPAYRKVRRDIGKIQTQRANQLVVDTGAIIPNNGADIPELRVLQQHLKEYNM